MNTDIDPAHDIGPKSSVEFVLLMAATMSLVALCIDAMLPAFPAIAGDLGVAASNDTQLIISLMFIGLALGQLFYGPLSDSIGRKPAIHAGFIRDVDYNEVREFSFVRELRAQVPALAEQRGIAAAAPTVEGALDHVEASLGGVMDHLREVGQHFGGVEELEQHADEVDAVR